MQEIAIIGVPVDLGAGRRGVDMGPSAIRYAGIKERLLAMGYAVRDLGNVAAPQAEQVETPLQGERMRYLEPLRAVHAEVARVVREVLASGAFPLILGGDHSLSIGSIAGVASVRRAGVLWIDAHGDFNTPETTPSGNIHGMSTAPLTGRGHPLLSNLLGNGPALRDGQIALVGTRDLDDAERDALKASGVHVFPMHSIDRRGIGAVMEEAMKLVGAGTDGLHLSLDLDALDPREAPGVGTPVLGGLTYREMQLAMEMVAESRALISMDLVEVNPILDRSNATAELAVEFALSALGKRTF